MNYTFDLTIEYVPLPSEHRYAYDHALTLLAQLLVKDSPTPTPEASHVVPRTSQHTHSIAQPQP